MEQVRARRALRHRERSPPAIVASPDRAKPVVSHDTVADPEPAPPAGETVIVTT